MNEVEDAAYVLLPRLGTFDEEPGGGEVFLLDRNGEVVKEWQLPHAVAGHVELNPNGDLVYLGWADEYQSGDWASPAPGEAGVLQIIGWDGQVKQTIRDPLIHHDFAQVGDHIAILRWQQILDPGSVAGGISNDDQGSETVLGDEIVLYKLDGSEEVVWSSETDLDRDSHPIPPFLDRSEWTHANSLSFVESNPLNGRPSYLVSFRTISTIALIDASSGEMTWEYQRLNQQHDPTLTEDGTVLVFDNGQYRPIISGSTVVEIAPDTDEVVWSYAGPGVAGHLFYSALISGSQRLASGNTFITEGMTGRLFEVTPQGQIVWEYINPFQPPDRFGGAPNPAVFKARVYSASFIEPLLNG